MLGARTMRATSRPAKRTCPRPAVDRGRQAQQASTCPSAARHSTPSDAPACSSKEIPSSTTTLAAAVAGSAYRRSKTTAAARRRPAEGRPARAGRPLKLGIRGILVDPPARTIGPVDLRVQHPVDAVARAFHEQRAPGAGSPLLGHTSCASARHSRSYSRSAERRPGTSCSRATASFACRPSRTGSRGNSVSIQRVKRRGVCSVGW